MATPNINDVVKKFSQDLNNTLAAYRAEVAKKENKKLEEVPELRTRLSKLTGTAERTPKEQAQDILKNISWTCSSAHMGDNARHLDLFKDTKYIVKPKSELTPEEYKALTEAWTDAMKKNGLLNYAAREGYDEGDAFHVELPDGKLPFSDKRVQECLEYYAEMTRDKSGKKNVKFEVDS